MSETRITAKVFLFLLSLTAVGVAIGIYSPWEKIPSLKHFSIVLVVKPARPPRPATKLKPHSCSCSNSCLTDDQELRRQRLGTFVQPLLSKNYNLSEDDHAWWRLRQGERNTLSQYETTVKGLFELFPPEPDVPEPKLDKCRSCAVVGNSPRLLGANYGPIIDSQDFVIRINNGVVKGFEKDVGTRTTHRAMYPVTAQNLESTTHLLYYGFKLSDLQYLIAAFTTGYKGKVKYLPKIEGNKNLVSVLNPAFMKYVHQQWLNKKGNYPSTGMLTVCLAMFICDEVHVFGFGADSKGIWTHYWDKPDPTLKKGREGNHPHSAEFEALERFDKDGRIKFHRGL